MSSSGRLLSMGTVAGPSPLSSSLGRVPLQSRNPNTICGSAAGVAAQGSFSSRGGVNSSTEEYNSKDMGNLNRLSTLESSQNENNKRLTNSTSYAAGGGPGSHSRVRSSNNSLHSQSGSLHVRRNSSNDVRDGSDPGVPTTTSSSAASSKVRPKAAQRSNSLPSPIDSSNANGSGTLDEDGVVIEEKRRKVNGDGYTIHRYLRGRLLGKGGFAKVYLCTALDTNKAYAIKIVPKSNLVKARARQKLQAEIKIHRTLKHQNVCEYKHFFEDRQNCYILLELCHNQSMNEMIKRRKRLTEPETTFLMKQLLVAVKYMHDQLVIHRDLKLGNLFLDRNLNIKVGDLGLATKLESADEKRKTICGTPNYIAPEIIQGDRSTRGHSFEVDVWSMGVIMFTCLCGKPPYEAKDVKATYQRILANEYSFPRDISISNDAKDLISTMLQSKPSDRPSLEEIRVHPFFTARAIPESLPPNATHVAPQWEKDGYGGITVAASTRQGLKTIGGSGKPALPRSNSQRRPFGSRDTNVDGHGYNSGTERAERKVIGRSASLHGNTATPVSSASSGTAMHSNPIADVQGAVKSAWSAVVNAATATTPSSAGFQVFDETEGRNAREDKDLVSRTANLGLRTTHDASPYTSSASPYSLSREPIVTPTGQGGTENDMIILNSMVDRITTVLDIVASRSYANVPFDARSLVASTRGEPSKWVSRYVDYTSKYGLGYLLNDGSSGVYFNDSTKTILEAVGDNFLYIERKKSSVDAARRSDPAVSAHTLDQYPDSLQKKVTLLKHFRNYLIEQQQKSGDNNASKPSANPSMDNSRKGMTYLKKWVRTKHAIFFRLSDQTVQIVFYDHTEILLTPDERYVTFVDKSKTRNTYFLTDELVGCNSEIAKRLKYTKEILQQLGGGTTTPRT